MNDIVWEVLFGFLLFVVFGIIPTYVCYLHNNHINNECYLILEEPPIQNI